MAKINEAFPYNECKKQLLLRGYTANWWKMQGLILNSREQLRDNTKEALEVILKLPFKPVNNTLDAFKRFLVSEGIRYIDLQLAFGHRSVNYTKRWIEAKSNQRKVKKSLTLLRDCRIKNEEIKKQKKPRNYIKPFNKQFNPILHTGEDVEYLI